MGQDKLSIPNITCGHCVMTIERELGDIDGVRNVEGDPAAKEITVNWDAPGVVYMRPLCRSLKEKGKKRSY